MDVVAGRRKRQSTDRTFVGEYVDILGVGACSKQLVVTEDAVDPNAI